MKACGAKTRSGSPCKRSPMPNGRCYLHGGPSSGAPKGNRNALRHGLKSREYLEGRKLIRAMRSFQRGL
ncbi:HGGxSTG domain-containing protein [Sphingomicrobium nitratireducens]|uniref:HGGxSTG domain-containing protein n=1 Tax=Sphingomicrobium nitratireducens TaxID=2964666 RepID=UPI003B849F9F